MSLFKESVEKMVDGRVSRIAHPIMGVIPQGAIDVVNWVATSVRIPNPHGAIHPAGGEEPPYLEFQNVPLPFSGWAIFQAFEAVVATNSRPVMVGFRGGSLYFPYIISFVTHVRQDKESQGVPNRQPIMPSKIGATALPPKLAPAKPPAPPPPPDPPKIPQPKTPPLAPTTPTTTSDGEIKRLPAPEMPVVEALKINLGNSLNVNYPVKKK